MNKKIIVYMVILALFLTSFITVWADVQDYRTVQFYNDSDKDVFKPTAQFYVTHKGTTYESPVGTDINSNAVVINAVVGDTVTVADMSHSNRGKILKVWDFQYTRPDGNNQFINTQAFEKSYSLDTTGRYTFSLCVRDTVENEVWTNYWGNWSDNGNHQVIGHNPGKNLSDPSDDFDGYWYFTRIVVIVSEKTYTLQEKHIASDSGIVLDDTLHEGITDNSLTTRSNSFDGYDFIGSRAGYTWSEIANGTTENISTRTANFDSSHKTAYHYYYYKKSAPPPPPTEGKASIVVYYKDKVSSAAVHPADETTYKDVNYGTYTIAALPAPEGYTFDTMTTPSPQTVTLDAANNYKQVTFYYQPESAPVLRSPVAKLTGPEKVYAGDDFRVSAKDSYATEPGAIIKQYMWDINRYTASYPPIEDTDKSITLWSDAVEGDYCSVEVEVVDSNGMTDTAKIGIEVLPPVPIAKIDVTGELRENRRVNLSCLNSFAPRRFPINEAKIVWEISAVSGGTADNILYKGSLTGAKAVISQYSKAGRYKVKVYIETVPGCSDTEEIYIDILPDLEPISDFSVPNSILRDPNDNNYATAVITDLSYSPDGDILEKNMCLEVYDSDNDRNFDEETVCYSVDGTTWINTGMTFVNVKKQFDFRSVANKYNKTFIHKSKEVGCSLYEVIVIDGIQDDKTIKEFLKPDDYRMGTTWE